MPRTQYDWQLPPPIEARLGEDSYGPQRAISEGGHLFLVLHQPPANGSSQRQHALFLRSPDGALACNGALDGRPQLQRLLQAYRARHEACEDSFEKAGNAMELLTLMGELSPLNRTSTNLLNALQAARDAAKADRFLIGARDEAYEISRSFDLLAADTQHAINYHLAKNAEEQAARTEEMTVAQHKLNILAAFTFPVMAVATLFGMNMTSGLEERGELLFWSSIGLGIVTGFFVKTWVVKTRPRKAAVDSRDDR